MAKIKAPEDFLQKSDIPIVSLIPRAPKYADSPVCKLALERFLTLTEWAYGDAELQKAWDSINTKYEESIPQGSRDLFRRRFWQIVCLEPRIKRLELMPAGEREDRFNQIQATIKNLRHQLSAMGIDPDMQLLERNVQHRDPAIRTLAVHPYMLDDESRSIGEVRFSDALQYMLRWIGDMESELESHSRPGKTKDLSAKIQGAKLIELFRIMLGKPLHSEVSIFLSRIHGKDFRKSTVASWDKSK